MVRSGGDGMSSPPAAADCELIRDGLLGQPVNTASALAFVAIGVMLARRRPVLGGAAIGVGIGSILFHGPMPSWAEWAHDVTLAALIVAVVLEHRWLWVVVATGLLGIGFAALPAAAEATTAVLAVVTLVVIARRVGSRPSSRQLAAFALFAAGVATATLSRTGGPLCAPDSLLQGHAAWHLLGAAGLWAWAQGDALGSRP